MFFKLLLVNSTFPMSYFPEVACTSLLPKGFWRGFVTNEKFKALLSRGCMGAGWGSTSLWGSMALPYLQIDHIISLALGSNQLPAQINRSRPHEHGGFDVLRRQFSRPQRCVWGTRPRVSSGALQSKIIGELERPRSVKNEAKPRRVAARSVFRCFASAARLS